MAITYYDSIADEIKSDDLYFILAGDMSVKIGRSNDVESRANNLQIANCQPITIYAVLKGRGWQEPLWHKAFRTTKIRGEWFIPCDGLRAAIDAAVDGKEWIATLIAPPDFAARQVGLAEIAECLKCSEQEAANFQWRNMVADWEEDLLCAMPDERQSHLTVRQITGLPKSKHSGRKASSLTDGVGT